MTERDRNTLNMQKPDRKYVSGEYLRANPSWDIEDSPWKAEKVAKILSGSGFNPVSICEVGCGAGGVLAGLRAAYPEVDLYGFDISPDAAGFWEEHSGQKIHFQLGDFFELNKKHYDVLLVLDVIEHVIDPWKFLEGLKPWSRPVTGLINGAIPVPPGQVRDTYGGAGLPCFRGCWLMP